MTEPTKQCDLCGCYGVVRRFSTAKMDEDGEYRTINCFHSCAKCTEEVVQKMNAHTDDVLAFVANHQKKERP